MAAAHCYSVVNIPVPKTVYSVVNIPVPKTVPSMNITLRAEHSSELQCSRCLFASNIDTATWRHWLALYCGTWFIDRHAFVFSWQYRAVTNLLNRLIVLEGWLSRRS